MLGIDFGERRIGIAISDPGGTFALPLTTLERRDDASAAREIAELASREEISRIVVGEPRGRDGAVGSAARRARSFAERLATRYRPRRRNRRRDAHQPGGGGAPRRGRRAAGEASGPARRDRRPAPAAGSPRPHRERSPKPTMKRFALFLSLSPSSRADSSWATAMWAAASLRRSPSAPRARRASSKSVPVKARAPSSSDSSPSA